MILSIDHGNCINCGVCWKVCPEDVLYPSNDPDKFVEIRYIKDCVACFVCEAYCPQQCINGNAKRSRDLPLPY